MLQRKYDKVCDDASPGSKVIWRDLTTGKIDEQPLPTTFDLQLCLKLRFVSHHGAGEKHSERVRCSRLQLGHY